MLFAENGVTKVTKPFGTRIKLETIVSYGQGQETVFSDLSENLSVGGLYLKTKSPSDLDKTLMVSFVLPGQEQAVSCKANVAWTNFEINPCKPSFPSGVGLQFVDLLHEDLISIARFIDEHDAETTMTVTCAWCNTRLGERRGPAGITSHGICGECFEGLKDD